MVGVEIGDEVRAGLVAEQPETVGECGRLTPPLGGDLGNRPAAPGLDLTGREPVASRVIGSGEPCGVQIRCETGDVGQSVAHRPVRRCRNDRVETTLGVGPIDRGEKAFVQRQVDVAGVDVGFGSHDASAASAAARAWRRVVGKYGTATSSGPTSSSISVQPAMMPSQPLSTSRSMIPR